MNRRVAFNHALLYAAQLANENDLPLLVYEGLTCSYPYASDRFHTFILEGVPRTEQQLQRLGIGYMFYLRRRQTDPNNALYKLAENAAALVTDDYPAFIARQHNESVSAKLPIPYWVVDSSCIAPMNLLPKREWAAYTIRPKIRKLLPQYLQPTPNPRVHRKFTYPIPDLHTPVTAATIPDLVASCDIDHTIHPSPSIRGGAVEAKHRLNSFLSKSLYRYANSSNEPSEKARSGLSPYLHFGHISSLDVALRVQQYAEEHKLIPDEFLEELIVRRELAFNFARYTEAIESLDSLPDWARKTLEKHSHDKRQQIYSRHQFERAETHDDLWNAAQKELLITGEIHGYYRMYWGKKIIEWSATHTEALATMIYLNDRYALDGRDPNTYTNILWCFGLHDRPWAERPIFGQVRYMSYEGMRRKTNVDAYVAQIRELE